MSPPVALLVATAVAAERDAVRAGLAPGTSHVTVADVGVGPAAAAAGTARLLALAEAAGRPYRAVVSAGIAGGFCDRTSIGATVLGSRSLQADLGAESPQGFLPLDQLGFGDNTVPVDSSLQQRLHTLLPDVVAGDILTVATVTGSAARADQLAAAHPAAVAEAMEGYGVGYAAAAAGAAFVELRTISNEIGPRDRAAWRITEALAALTTAAAALAAVDLPAPLR